MIDIYQDLFNLSWLRDLFTCDLPPSEIISRYSRYAILRSSRTDDGKTRICMGLTDILSYLEGSFFMREDIATVCLDQKVSWENLLHATVETSLITVKDDSLNGGVLVDNLTFNRDGFVVIHDASWYDYYGQSKQDTKISETISSPSQPRS